MGLFGASSSLARMVGPLGSGAAFQVGGGTLAFGCTTALFTITFLVVLFGYPKLKVSKTDSESTQQLINEDQSDRTLPEDDYTP